jgi:hypothetical protein
MRAVNGTDQGRMLSMSDASDLLFFDVLPDHVVMGRALDDRLDVQDLVAGDDEKVGRLGANFLVLAWADLEHLLASRVPALADDAEGRQPLAECGNSGNSSVPHLHYQLMDGPDVLTARGLPFSWEYTDDDGRRHSGVPENLTHLTAGP